MKNQQYGVLTKSGYFLVKELYRDVRTYIFPMVICEIVQAQNARFEPGDKIAVPAGQLFDVSLLPLM